MCRHSLSPNYTNNTSETGAWITNDGGGQIAKSEDQETCVQIKTSLLNEFLRRELEASDAPAEIYSRFSLQKQRAGLGGEFCQHVGKYDL